MLHASGDQTFPPGKAAGEAEKALGSAGRPVFSAASKFGLLTILSALGALFLGLQAGQPGHRAFLETLLVLGACACLYGCYVFFRVSRILAQD